MSFIKLSVPFLSGLPSNQLPSNELPLNQSGEQQNNAHSRSISNSSVKSSSVKSVGGWRLTRLVTLIACCLITTACIGSAIGVVVDAAIEVVKVPFKVGGAIIDVATGDDDFAEQLADHENGDEESIDSEQAANKMEASEYQ